MKRRDFLTQSVALGALTQLNFVTPAKADTVSGVDLHPSPALRGRSQGFFEIRHQHEFVLPIEVLIQPPIAGYSARSSTPIKGETDFDGLKNRTDSAGRPLDLRGHAHTVNVTFEQLQELSIGKYVVVHLDQFGHTFYLVANDVTLAAIREARSRS